MKTTARVVVIGGGVVGCSILYHLSKMGWSDVVLLERQELTAGSSWHAAGSLYTLTSPSNASVLQKYTIDLYPELEKESGQDCGLHYNGELLIAKDAEEVKTLSIARSEGLRNGIESEFISPAEAKEMLPILNTDGITAVLYEKDAGYCDPASVTNAFAKAARKFGSTIYRHTPVTATNQLPNGEWDVVTEKGTIRTEYVVNAAGLWAREVAALAGIKLPLIPVEHHYLVTEAVPELEAMGRPHVSLGYADANLYMRQEGNGLLIGAYENKCIHWSEKGTPLDFGHELLPNDIDRMEDNFLQAVDLMPCLGESGIKSIINGPMIFSPDLGPLLGPYPGKKGYICATGVMTGFNQGGGIGKVLAEWIIEGEPSMDVSFWDVARFGGYAGKRYAKIRAGHYYENRSTRVYPHEQLEKARPMKTTPIHDRLAAAGAVFGEYCGWEDPLWYARSGEEAVDQYSYGRGNWFEAVGEECRAVREAAGLFETSSFAKYKFTGPKAFEWLNNVFANAIPETVGKTVLSPMLSPKGKLIGDFTVTRLGDMEFLALGSGVMEDIHVRTFNQHLPKHGVKLENLTAHYSGLHIAGPNARAILSELSDGEDVSGEAFPFLSGRYMEIGPCPEAVAVRVSFTGELGYELYFPMGYQRAVYDEIIEIGKRHGLRHAGGHALMSLRLEKGFPSWGVELTSDYFPHETSLGMFVRYKKGDFIGREAALSQKETRPRERNALFEVDVDGVDVYGGEAIFKDGEYVGYATSGGYGYCAEMSLALAYIKPEAYKPGEAFAIEILGVKRPAVLLKGAVIDPTGKRMRNG